MILGKDAYLGSFNLKSVVTIAGLFSFKVCKPPSISLVTVTLFSSKTTSEAFVA